MKKWTKILQLKNTVTELKKKKSIDNFNSRLNQAEERLSELQYRSFEIIQSNEQKEKNEWKIMKKYYKTDKTPRKEITYSLRES